MIKSQRKSAVLKISFMGASLQTGNMGVSALCAATVKLLKGVNPSSEILLFIGNRKSEIQTLITAKGAVNLEVVNYRLSPKAKLHQHLLFIFLFSWIVRLTPGNAIKKAVINKLPFLCEMEKCAFVGDISGGDSFSDIYGLLSFVVTSLPSIIALLIGKKLVLLPQTYGPFNSKIAKLIASFILSRAHRVYCRDRQGLEYVQAYQKKERVCSEPIFCPDVAFMLDAIEPDSLDIEPVIDFSDRSPLVGINVNGLMYSGGYTRDNMFGLTIDYKKLMERMVKALLEAGNCRILFVPHTFGPKGNVNSDPDASRSVIANTPAEYRDRLYILARKYDQSELKQIIGYCDFFIGSRMHSCIASLSQGIPTIGIAYSKKFLGVFDSVGMGNNVLDARKLDEQDIIDQTIKHYQNRTELKSDTKNQVSVAQKRIETVFAELMETSQSEK